MIAMKSKKNLSAMLLAALLPLAACGTDDDATTETDDTTSTTEVAETTETTAAETTETTAAETSESTEAEGDSMDDSSEDDADDSADDGSTDEGAADSIGEATFAIGDTEVVFNVSECAASGEATVAFKGESDDGTMIDVNATDMEGSIIIDGPEGSWEGQIDTVLVSDTGDITVTGEASMADDSAGSGAEPFEVTGFTCDA